MNRFLAYMKFLFASTNEHGVHSPFVFDLVTKCFYDRKDFSEYKTLRKYISGLQSDKRFIEVTDFGAGSKVFRSNKRQVARIAANAGISRKRARLLLRLVKYFQPTAILELGTSLGLATAAMALGKPYSKIISIEGCPETAAIAVEFFKKFQFKNIEMLVLPFEQYFQNLQENQKFDMVYFDGNHRYRPTIAYAKALLATAHNGSVWIFDDIHWSEEMDKAWIEIKSWPEVRVTVDTYQWGLVFFRMEQAKEHFTIRA